ncbi:hypothetical protein GMO_10810 [Gluconobacter morbifer G707]|uniref:Protein-export membrane protein SecG n=1 Tax=Gluconobacter morbifer G707 TaxID=1088869 RepID=G6XHT7_9PROT|nr:hypothetical protein GMO_10810 [Gluconobacter morbifer G707]
MTTLLLAINMLVTLALIGVILIQRSEGGGLGIGSGQGMGSFMTGRGTATLLTRATAVLASIFHAAVPCSGRPEPRCVFRRRWSRHPGPAAGSCCRSGPHFRPDSSADAGYRPAFRADCTCRPGSSCSSTISLAGSPLRRVSCTARPADSANAASCPDSAERGTGPWAIGTGSERTGRQRTFRPADDTVHHDGTRPASGSDCSVKPERVSFHAGTGQGGRSGPAARPYCAEDRSHSSSPPSSRTCHHAYGQRISLKLSGEHSLRFPSAPPSVYEDRP